MASNQQCGAFPGGCPSHRVLQFLFPVLYGRVFIPPAVAGERSHPDGPEPTRQWIEVPSGWLRVGGVPEETTEMGPRKMVSAGEESSIPSEFVARHRPLGRRLPYLLPGKEPTDGRALRAMPVERCPPENPSRGEDPQGRPTSLLEAAPPTRGLRALPRHATTLHQ